MMTLDVLLSPTRKKEHFVSAVALAFKLPAEAIWLNHADNAFFHMVMNY